MRNGTAKLHALNVPERVQVQLGVNGPATVVTRKPEDGRRVEAICEVWRIDDEWWRAPISRRYFEVVLESGKRVVLFEDQITSEWWMQKP